MAYLVLARKWRPQTFEEIVGQQAIAQTLANSIIQNRIGHAFLFAGPRGVGKTSAARILSKALNCMQGPTATPCNTCQHCKEITAGNSLDVLEIDGASNRGIEEIRSLRENIKYAPSSAHFKIIIIDEVHMLTREAFNALLKTLEEPPPHAKFIMATTEIHKVPITIVSRCQRFDFRRIDLKSLTSALIRICTAESVTVEDRTLDIIARIADGSMRDALSILDQVIAFSGSEIVHDEVVNLLGKIDPDLMWDMFRALGSNDAPAALQRFSNYVESGGDERVFNEELLHLTSDLMTAVLGGVPRRTIPADIVSLFTIDQLERIFKTSLDLESVLRISEHPRIVLEAALIKISRFKSLEPLESIIAKLELLLSQQSGAPATQTAPVRTGSQPPSEPKPPKPALRPRVQQPSLTQPQQVNTEPAEPQAEPQITPPPPKDSANAVIRNAIAHISGDESISACLEYGSVLELTDSKIVIGFDSVNAFQMSRLNTPEKRSTIENAFAQATGRKLHVEMIEKPVDKGLSVVQEQELQKKKLQTDRINLAMQQDSVHQIVDMFGAHIREINVKPVKKEPVEENQS